MEQWSVLLDGRTRLGCGCRGTGKQLSRPRLDILSDGAIDGPIRLPPRLLPAGARGCSEWIIQWLEVNSQSCVTLATHSSTFPPLRRNPCARSWSRPPTPGNYCLLSISVDLSILDISFSVWNRTACGLSWVTSFSEHNVSEVPPCCSMCRDAGPSQG